MTQPDGHWFKSSFSGSSACLEVRFDRTGVHVRDSKDRVGSVLNFTRAEWDAFLRGVEGGEFELPAE